MGEQKKPSVRDVLWRKKRARDRVLDAVGKLCDEAWAIFEKIAADRSAHSRDAVTAREMSLRLRSLAYLIEGEHYIDRIAFELQTKEVYLTANEVAGAYVSEIVIAYLDAILLYGRQCRWDSRRSITRRWRNLSRKYGRRSFPKSSRQMTGQMIKIQEDFRTCSACQWI